MSNTLVKYLLILGFFLLGNAGKATVGHAASLLTVKQGHLQAEQAKITSGKLCFVHGSEIDRPEHYVVQEEWEEEEDSSESFGGDLLGLLSLSSTFCIPPGYLLTQPQRSGFTSYQFTASGPSRYLLFRVFRI